MNNLHREADEKLGFIQNHIHTDIHNDIHNVHEENDKGDFTYNADQMTYTMSGVIEKIFILSVSIFLVIVILSFVSQSLLSFVIDLRNTLEELAYNTLYVGVYAGVILLVCAGFYVVYRILVYKFFG
jgi:hypothetical protein